MKTNLPVRSFCGRDSALRSRGSSLGLRLPARMPLGVQFIHDVTHRSAIAAAVDHDGVDGRFRLDHLYGVKNVASRMPRTAESARDGPKTFRLSLRWGQW